MTIDQPTTTPPAVVRNDPEPPPAARRRSSLGTHGLSLLAIRYSGVIAIGLLVVGFSMYLPGLFLTEITFRTIIANQAVTGILALAALIPLAAGLYDLSFAAVAGLSLVLTVRLSAETDYSILVIAAIAIGCAALCGLVSATLVAFVGLDSFIVTLGMSSLVLGIALRVTEGNTMYGVFDPGFVNIGQGSIGPVPYLTVALIGLAVIVWLWLEHTPAGRYTLAVGSNPVAARLAGVSVARTYFLTLLICSVVAGAAGVLLAAQVGIAATSTGPAYLLPALAALLLGATQVRDRPNVAGAIIAVFLLGTGIKGLQLAGADSYVTEVFNGGVLIAAVAAASVRSRRAAIGG